MLPRQAAGNTLLVLRSSEECGGKPTVEGFEGYPVPMPEEAAPNLHHQYPLV